MALGLLLLLGAILSRLISVNDFSLHGMYRKRLARTFLGTSRPPEARHPNPFTGFDDEDDLAIHETAAAGRPLHVVNATLNLVAQTSLAMQERRSESFTHDRAALRIRRGLVTAPRMPTPAASPSASASRCRGPR